MESPLEEDNINNKYIILEEKGHGSSAYVYLVEDKKDKKLYAAKVFELGPSFFIKEIEILKKVSSLYNPFIIKLIEYGEGPVKAPSKPKKDRKYAILEYASKGILSDYIYCPEKGFSERHVKLIFHKILKGVKAIHNAGICHRDIKLENIVLDDKFDPKICDFGLGSEIKGKDGSGKLDEFCGSQHYKAPEIILRKRYEGVKADIFSLGVVLLSLVTNAFGFGEATVYNKFYSLIIKKKSIILWDSIIKYFDKKSEIKNSFLILTEELKNLYIKMVSYNPNLRPSIDDILDDPWMKEVTSLDDKEYSELEKEVYEEFKKREKDVINNNETINIHNNNNNNKICSGNDKGISDDEFEYFDLSLTPKYIQKSRLIMNNYIKINGNLRPSEFMNSLANKIVEKFEGNAKIKESKKNLKFNVVFEEPLEDEVELDEELKKEIEKLSLESTEELEEVIPQKNCVIQIKLFQCINGGYLVRFMKKEGEIEEYHKYFQSIKAIIKEIL